MCLSTLLKIVLPHSSKRCSTKCAQDVNSIVQTVNDYRGKGMQIECTKKQNGGILGDENVVLPKNDADKLEGEKDKRQHSGWYSHKTQTVGPKYSKEDFIL